MKKSAYKELEEVEGTFWWHVGRIKIIEKQLEMVARPKNKPFKILNVGAGTGGTIPMLEKFGTVVNADTSKEAIRYLERKGYAVTEFDGFRLPFKKNSFDMVVALDVLEHTSNDIETLRDWLRVLRPGGTLVVTVPAYQWLWSEHDVANMHFRRYTRRRLRSVMCKAGIQDASNVGYMIVFSLPLIVGYRMLGKAKKLFQNKKIRSSPQTNLVGVPGPINKFFVRLLNIEGSIQKRVNLPFGTSVVARVRK